MAEPKGMYNHFDGARHRYTNICTALESSLKSLAINATPSKSASSFKTAKAKQQVSESWDDEELEDSGEDTDRPLSHQQSLDYPSAPPPTPISPSTSFKNASYVNPYGYNEDAASARRPSDVRRPDKTDAMAKRMIAGALGVRAPKRSEEQKEYDKAIKEKETKRREKEKEDKVREQAEKERQKQAIWDD